MSSPANDELISAGGSNSKGELVATTDECQGDISVIIQVSGDDEWLGSIMKEERESSSSDTTILPKHKIPKVPQMLRQVEANNKCYDPEVVAIGPYHHHNAELQSFENLKIRLTREYVKSCTKTSSTASSTAAELYNKMLWQVEANKKCYHPEVVSIGPYHHHKIELQSFENLKIRLTREYVKICKKVSSAAELYNKVEDLVGEARKCYTEESTRDFDDRAFTRMMFLDGCFIIQFVSCIAEKKEADLKMKNHNIAFVRRDLFLLENQLPFKVLKALMDEKFGSDKSKELIKEFIKMARATPPEDSFLDKVEKFIIRHITDRKRPQTTPEELKDEPAHLLEVLRMKIIDPHAFNGNRGSSTRSSNWYSYRSVQELKTAGIQFRPNEKRVFTDVRYEPLIVRAILRLPPMTIDDSSQAILLNLVAYEMCPDSPNDFGVTSYLWFMDTLIDQAEDVKELRKKGIILNYLGSDEEVARLFNEIAKNLVPNPHAYQYVIEQIENHYKNKIRLWLTEWLHTHFSSPWTFLAFLAALFAIALSFVQTYYAVHPAKNSN